ncbi:MAG: AEC family transporter [Lachnospiraceae bacterium]|nr:AEC family transporter [Lachnospiraceae bacterium]
MDSLIFSLNATMPVFLVMVVGYILKQIGMLSEEFVKCTNKFVFVVCMPALLFKDIYAIDIINDFDLKYVAFCAIVTLFCTIVIWGVTRLCYDSSDRGEFIQGAYRGSAAIFGAAFIENIYGNTGMAPLMIIGAVPLYNMFAVIILTLEAPGRDNNKFKKTLVDVCKNPMIISIFVGIVFSYLGIDLPKIADTTIEMFARLVSPLALICIGAGFEGKKAIARIKPTVIATIIKLLVQPVIFIPIAIWIGFTGDKLVALLIMLGAPTTASAYIMAKNMNHEGVLSSSIIVLTTILSSFTITAGLFILRFYGYV